MDLVCTRCGEPWDIHHVIHDAPEEFNREGGVILCCPCCQGKKVKLSNQERQRLNAIQAIGEVLGDDIDALAAEIEDLGLL